MQEHLAGPVEEEQPPGFWKVYRELAERGLLLESDSVLPSIATLVAGAPVKGSWWSHPEGRAIFAVASALHDHGDVLVVKLVDAKLTYVHRRFFSYVHRVATSGEPWQTDGLSRDAKALLARVLGETSLRATGRTAAELERRLLVHATSVHGKSGAHEKVLETWERWAESAGLRPRAMKLETATWRLESAVAALAGGSGLRPRLPWCSGR